MMEAIDDDDAESRLAPSEGIPSSRSGDNCDDDDDSEVSDAKSCREFWVCLEAAPVGAADRCAREMVGFWNQVFFLDANF